MVLHAATDELRLDVGRLPEEQSVHGADVQPALPAQVRREAQGGASGPEGAPPQRAAQPPVPQQYGLLLFRGPFLAALRGAAALRRARLLTGLRGVVLPGARLDLALDHQLKYLILRPPLLHAVRLG